MKELTQQEIMLISGGEVAETVAIAGIILTASILAPQYAIPVVGLAAFTWFVFAK